MRVFFRLIIIFFIFPANIALYAEDFSKWPVKESNKFIKEIKSSRNFTWVSTAGGLMQVSKKTFKVVKVFKSSNGLPDDFITSIEVEPGEKGVWVATPSGLARIDLKSGKTAVYNKRNSKLTDNNVNTLCLQRNLLFIGTSYGVDIFDLSNNTWKSYTAIEGLAGGNIQVLTSDGYIVWAGGSDGISYYDPNEDFWDNYGVENGLNASLVTSLSLDYDAIWVGTMGGGVSRFDRETLRFEPYTSDEGLVDDNIQFLMDDGKYVWVGTFGGLSRLDKNTLIFKNYDTRNGLKEASITSGFIKGKSLYVGTDGGGVFTSNKNFPQIRFLSNKSGYEKKKILALYATVLSEKPIKDLKLSYRQIATADQYDYTPIKEVQKWNELKISSNKMGDEIKLSSWNTSSLPDGKYLVSISGKDTAGNENMSTGMVIVDNTAPKLQLFFRKPAKGASVANVSGTYQELNLADLQIKIGPRKIVPTVNRQTRRFRFQYPLSSRDQIQVIASDIGQNNVEIKRAFVVDQDPPELTLNAVDINRIVANVAEITGTVKDKNIDQVVVLPDQVVAELTPIGNDTYRFKARASIKKEGVYTYQVSATDKGGKNTVKTLEVNFVSKITIVEIRNDKIPKITLKKSVDISGNLLGPPLVEFYAVRVDTGQRIDIKIKEDKSFSTPVPLKKGDNQLQIVKVYDDGRKEIDDIKIKSSNTKVEARIDNKSTSFIKKNVTITGTFDSGIKKLFINRKSVQLDLETRTFSFPRTLKRGENKLKMSWVDELGRIGKKKTSVFLDNEPPTLFVRRLPDQTGLKTITVTGRAMDNTSFQMVGYPRMEITELNPETGDFKAKLHLEDGINHIRFVIKDNAGNQMTRAFQVEYGPNFPKVQVRADALMEELDILRSEVTRLRDELKNRPRGVRRVSGLVASRIPRSAGLYWVPMAGKIKSYSLTAKVYLGNEKLGDVIAAYNGKNPRNLSKVLVPSPALFTLISRSRNRRTYEKIIQFTSLAYSKGARKSALEKKILSYMVRSKIFKRVYDYKGNSIFLTRKGTAVVILPANRKIPANLKRIVGSKELLVTRVSRKGITYHKY